MEKSEEILQHLRALAENTATLSDSMRLFCRSQAQFDQNQNQQQQTGSSLEKLLTAEFRNTQLQLDHLQKTLDQESAKRNTDNAELWRAIEKEREHTKNLGDKVSNLEAQLSDVRGKFAIISILVSASIAAGTALVMKGLGVK